VNIDATVSGARGLPVIVLTVRLSLAYPNE